MRADLIRRVHIPCLEKLTLPAPSGLLLKQQLELLRSVQQCIEEDEAALAEMMENSQGLEQVLSVPGIGPIIAAVIMSEVDDIGRFPSTKSSALTRASARRRAS